MCKGKNQRIPNFETLKLKAFNVEGLDRELQNPLFIDTLYESDISILYETWRGSDSKIALPGLWDFSLVRQKTKKVGRNSGGITIFCKDSIRGGIKVIKSSEGFVWLKLYANFFDFEENVFLCGAYIPPENSKNEVSQKTDYFEALAVSVTKYSEQGNIMIMGDLNARTGRDSDQQTEIPVLDSISPQDYTQILDRSSCDTKVNKYGKKLKQLCKDHNLVVANGRTPGDLLGNFTCYSNKGASVVDYVICDKPFLKKCKKMKVQAPMFNSAHTPIDLSLDCKVIHQTKSEKAPLPPAPKLIWDSTKAEVLKKEISSQENSEKLIEIGENIGSAASVMEIDKFAKDFTDLLFETSSKCMKLAKLKKMPKKPKKKSWFNSDCVKLKQRLKNLAKLFATNPKDPYIRGQLSVVKKEYKKTMRINKSRFEINNIEKLQSLTDDPKAFWKHIKKINNRCKTSNSNNVPSKTWVDHFSSLNKKDPSNDPQTHEYCKSIGNRVKTFLQQEPQTQCDITDRPFTLEEIKWGIKQLKKGKANGTDGISNDIIKCCEYTIAPIIMILFNKLVQMQHYPNQWSISVMIPIHKSGELSDPDNYRGISLNCCLSKLFTYLLNARLTQYCEENQIIHENQIGFRKGFRTSDHVLTLKTLVDQAFQSKKKLYVCFVDFKKAYDTVWRDGLYLKLLEYGVSPKFVNLIKDMYDRLQVSVNVFSGLSLPFRSIVGLKQGCNLSPMLFNIFINNIVNIMNANNDHAPFLGPQQVSCLLYADDLILVSETKEGLQESIDKLSQFTDKWFLEANAKKTKCLIFSKGRPSKTPYEWTLKGEGMEVCGSYCYLGVTFTSSGSMKTAAQVLNEKAVNAMFSLIRNTNKHGACSIEIMLGLFDKMIAPIGLYNSEVWGINMLPQDPNKVFCLLSAKNLSENPTERIQFKFLKSILRLPARTSNWAAMSEVGKYPLTLRIIKIICRFYAHLLQSPSRILQEVVNTNKALAAKGYNSYYSYVKRIFDLVGIRHLLYTCDRDEINYQINKLDKPLLELYRKTWEMDRVSYTKNSKLELFTQLKGKFECAEYLKLVDNPKQRSSLTKVRMSAHKYPIETGRYRKVERENRECPLCCKSIGNEEHYILDCPHPFIAKIRTPILAELYASNPTLSSMENSERLVFLINNKEKDTIQLTSKLCFKIQEIFQEITY